MQNDREKFKKEFISRLVRFSIGILAAGEQVKTKRVLWPIVDQIIRSATSIGANVVEAKSSSSKRDYLHFFEIALKSANETKYWLIVIKESSPEFTSLIEPLYREVEEISKVLGASVLTLKGKN